jgi:hypothetical protein
MVRCLNEVGPTSTLLLRVPRKWGQECGVILWTTTLAIGKSSKWVGYLCFVFFFTSKCLTVPISKRLNFNEKDPGCSTHVE